jgi:tetratricopeptide (TPR) repeat protein
LSQYHQDRFADGEKTLGELIAAGRATGETYNLLGSCLEKQGKRNLAVEAFAKAIEYEPPKESFYVDLARVLAESTKRRTAALEIANQARQRFPSSYDVWALKGSIETKLKQHTEAVQSYTVAAKLRPNLPERCVNGRSPDGPPGRTRKQYEVSSN